MKLWLKVYGREALLCAILLVGMAVFLVWEGSRSVKVPEGFRDRAIEKCVTAASEVVDFESEGSQVIVLPTGIRSSLGRRKGASIQWKNLEGGSSVICWAVSIEQAIFIEKLVVNGVNRPDLIERKER